MQRTLTALYDTRGAADAARDELVALGIPSADVTVRGSDATATTVRTETSGGGFWEGLKDLFLPDEDRYTYSEGIRRGGYLLTVNVPDGLEDEAIAILERSEPVDLETRASEWRASGWSGYEGDSRIATGTAATGAAYTTIGTGAGTAAYGLREDRAGTDLTGTASARATDDDTIEVMEEDIRVGKREVERGGVRVRSYVVERPVEEQVELRQERVTIERRPVDRPVGVGDAAFQERTIEAVERGEEAVISKTARVVEEIGVRKDVERETETVRDTVRKTEVEVEDDRTRTSVAGETVTGKPRR